MIFMKEPRRIEREFGVPVAGAILPQQLWTQTALKKLPPRGPLDWQALFGRRHSVVVDIGCGNGRFLIGSAVWRPDYDHLGIDVLPVVLRYATRRGNQRGLVNVRFAALDGRTLVEHYLAAGSVAEMHCYHPQPYYDLAQVHRRLMTPTFLALVHRGLEPGGKFFTQTDHPGYWRYMQALMPLFFDWRELPGKWPDAPKGRTRREIIALRRGLAVFRGWGMRREGAAEAEMMHLAESLPPPIFDAHQQLRELDALERE
jgi:tRNA (guanine-N7-)-methyltransferase